MKSKFQSGPMTGHGVVVDGRKMSFHELYETRKGQKLLAGLRGCEKGRISCSCCPGNSLPLLVQERGKAKKLYFLRCYMDTKSKHDANCQRHGQTAHGGARRTDSSKCVYESDGEIHVNLNESLSEEVVHAVEVALPSGIDAIKKASRNRASGSRREYSCGLQVGHLAFWTAAGLNGTILNWNPPDDWAELAKRISNGLPPVRFSGERASDVLVVAGIGRIGEHPRLHQRSIDGGKQYCLLIGELSRFERKPENPARTTLRFSNCETPVQIATATLENAVRCCAFPNAEALVASISEPRQMLTFVCMGRIERSDEGEISFVDLRLMVVSRFYIPVESRLESEMANELVRSGRRFLKPVLYDAQVDIVLPDFVVYDAGQPCVIEVFGVCGMPEYDAGTLGKRVLYEFNRDQITFVEWPGKGEFPLLPEVTRPDCLSIPRGIRTGLRLQKVPESQES